MKLPTEKHISNFRADKFGYKELSKKILDNVLLKMELPNCFGLYGNWGSGKSSILHLIQQHLKRKEVKYQKIVHIYFEPWKYEYAESNDLLFALLNEIGTKFGLSKNEKWKEFLVDILAIGFGLMRLANVDPQKTVKDLKYIEELLLENQKWVDKTKKIREDFKNIISECLKNDDTRFFIFIDDLDRCLPENSVKLLETIKNFLSIDQTLFILAVDRRIIGEMIEKKYLLHEGYGGEYLTKIIHYYYNLPSINQKDIIKEVLGSYKVKYSENQVSYINNFINNLSIEPRITKHLLHQLGINTVIHPKVNELLVSDNQNTELQYLFVATYLLVKHSDLFINRDPMIILRTVQESLSEKIRPGGNTRRYEEIINSDQSISPIERKKIEEVLQLTIDNGKMQLIKIDQLANAINLLSKFD